MLDITQFLLQFNSKSILQLISGISNGLKKLDRYFKETAIFLSLNFLLAPSAVHSLKRLGLHLKDVELSVVAPLGITALVMFCSSLLNYHKRPEQST